MPLTLEDFERSLREISSMLASVRARARDVKTATAESIVRIQAVPNEYSEVLAAIDAIDPQSADAWQASLIARKSRLQAEIVDLLADLQAARTALAELDL